MIETPHLARWKGQKRSSAFMAFILAQPRLPGCLRARQLTLTLGSLLAFAVLQCVCFLLPMSHGVCHGVQCLYRYWVHSPMSRAGPNTILFMLLVLVGILVLALLVLSR